MKKGKITYTGQGFEQDAGQAMKGDVVRALIEFITNADDAYGQLTGEIHLVLRRFSNSSEPTTISVIDTAKGLSTTQMEESFTYLGGDMSGFAQGDQVRGLFGRGSKDAAWFGRAKFESIWNGVYCVLILERNGVYTIDDRQATADDYKNLGIESGKVGLTATVEVRQAIARVPDLGRLVERLSSHVQLRQIIDQRKTTIREIKDGQLVQTVPIVWEEPIATILLDEEIELSAYGTKCHVLIKQLEARSDGVVTDYSVHGIEIRGARATYMNTMFSMTGHGVGLIRGIVTCTHIDELIRDFGKSKVVDPKNPIRLINRDRDGLSTTHPFFQTLSLAVVEKLKPILDALEPKNSNAGGSKLKSDLNRVARLLGELVQKDLDSTDPGTDVGDSLPTLESPISVIPPVLRGLVGSKRTLTLLVHKDSEATAGLAVQVSNQNVAVISEPSAFRQHPTFDEVVICQVRIALEQLGVSKVAISAQTNSALNASAEVYVHNDPRPEEEPPIDLEWKNPSMSVTVGKERSLTLRAPIEIAPEGVLEVMVSLDGETVELLEEAVLMRLTTKGWLIGRARVKGLGIGNQAKITASATGVIANGTLRTSLPSTNTGMNYEVKIVAESEGSTRGRVETTDTKRVILIFAEHVALVNYIGGLKRDGSFSGEHEANTRAVLAECVASVLSEFVVRENAENDPVNYGDIDMMIQQRTKYVTKYLEVLVDGLRGD